MKLVNIQDCQAEAQQDFTHERRPRFVFGKTGLRRRMRPALLAFSNLRRAVAEHGLPGALRRASALAAARLTGRPAERAKAPRPGAAELPALGLRPGEWVEVRPFEEILATLDADGKNRGLAFTFEMRAYCGRRFRVFKRLERMFNECTHEQRGLKNTVLLEGVYCQGAGFGCDRSCFHFWREAWLRRASEPACDTGGGGGR